jgi:hypothetical protein
MHNHKWFVGTLAVVTVLFFFLWATFNPDSLRDGWNRFIDLCIQIRNLIITIFLVWLGFKIMLKGNGKGRGH